MSNFTIRPAKDTDRQAMWDIFHQVIQTGDTYAYSPAMTQAEFEAAWFTLDIRQYVVDFSNDISELGGMYYVKPNFPGLGAHVANAGFMVNPKHHGKGLGKALGKHALAEAKRLGFQAMQFNFVVSTNTVAVKLWQSLGFNIIGTTPKAFQHNTLGLVDTYIMHQFL